MPLPGEHDSARWNSLCGLIHLTGVSTYPHLLNPCRAQLIPDRFIPIVCMFFSPFLALSTFNMSGGRTRHTLLDKQAGLPDHRRTGRRDAPG